MADPLQSLRQDVQQEAADELVGLEGHSLLSVVVSVVFPAEGHCPIVDIEETIIRDGDTMGIAADVIEDLLGSGKGRLGIDDPFLLSQRFEISSEGMALTQLLQGGEELEFTAVEGLRQQFQKPPTKEPRQHTYRQEEPCATRQPALPMGGEAAARHHTVQMGGGGQI